MAQHYNQFQSKSMSHMPKIVNTGAPLNSDIIQYGQVAPS